jgi:hypothetical protein
MEQMFGKNRHETACNGSQKFANHLANYAYNKLLAETGDPEIAAIITFYLVFITNWNKGYAEWHNYMNKSMEATEKMKLQTEELVKTKVPEWVGKIWGVYPQGTPKALALLPHDRKALISGTAQDKISGINTLVTGIGTDSQLQTLKTEMEAYSVSYAAMLSDQMKAQKRLSDASEDIEKLRLRTTAAMLCVEGRLVTKYYETPEMIDHFFDVSEMRLRRGKPKANEPIVVSLGHSEIKLINIDYNFRNFWEVTNNGTKDACVFFGNSSSITEIPPYKYLIAPDKTLKIDLSTLNLDMRFAYAGNPDATVDAVISILQVKK